MEKIKKILENIKKGEIAIYVVTLMLVGAGYFNYITFKDETEETYSEDVQELEEYANVGDAVLVSSSEFENINVEEIQEESEKTDEQNNENDYFVSSKLERDQMYAEMISSYESILNNTNVSEAQKTIATQEITKINNAKNAIMICENLILTKEFNECVVLVNEDSVNVVVSIEGGLNQENVAQIQNIISREIGTEIENIHISEI